MRKLTRRVGFLLTPGESLFFLLLAAIFYSARAQALRALTRTFQSEI
jgi:hypothetical protein